MRKILIIALYILLFWFLLPAILIISSVLLDTRLDFARESPGIMIVAGIVLILIGIPMLYLSIVQFREQGKGLPISALPSPVLIQQKLFSVWRHPVYLFYVVTFYGIAFLMASRSMLIVIMPLFILSVYFYIRIEERGLIKRFGSSYINYRERTPLVIPKLNQFLKIPAYFLFKGLFSYEVRNREHIPESPPFFLVSSHRNYLDPFFISLAMPFPVKYIATYEMFRKPLVRFLFKKLETIPKKRFKADIQTGREIFRNIQKEAVIGIFPEGERTWTGKMISLKQETLNLFRKWKCWCVCL